MFSSWPVSALVAGVKSGSGSRSDSRSPPASGSPAMVPNRWYSAHALPAGLRESERLPEPLFTPATKAETGHDENITFGRMRSELGADLAERIREASLLLYGLGRDHAERSGLILADTKFEFGLIDDRPVLIDEALTPDSSRYWDAATYRVGSAPDSFDKQFVRDWLSASGWDRNSPPPELPPEIVEQTRQRYLTAYERLTGVALA